MLCFRRTPSPCCQVNGRPLVVLPRKNINMVSVHLTREDRQLYDR